MNLKLKEIVFSNLPEKYYQNACNPLNDAIIIPHICALRAYKNNNNNNSKKIRSSLLLHLFSFGRLCNCTLASREPNGCLKTELNFA